VRIRQILALVIVCVLAMPILLGQAITPDEITIISQPFIPQQPNAIRVQSTLVDVNVVVRDAHGQPISGLTKDDFQVFDQGKEQKITSFTAESAPVRAVQAPQTTAAAPVAPPPPTAPRYLGLYFDDLNTTTGELLYSRKAAEKYILHNMEENDRAGIFTSSATVTQQFTGNKQQLLDTLAKLLSHKRDATFHDCLNITPYEAFQIALISNTHSDALDLAIAKAIACGRCDPRDLPGCTRVAETQAATVLSLSEIFAQDSLGVLGDIIRYMGKMPGRRTLIMASSGFFSESTKIQLNVDKMVDAAIRAGIIVNTLDAKGLYAPNDPGDPPLVVPGGALGGYEESLRMDERHVAGDAMSALAEGTGGKFYHNNNDLDSGLLEMAAQPAASYVIGFSPDDVKDNGVYHNLKVRVPNKSDISISARPGYFARNKEQAAPAAKFQKLNREVLASDTLSEIAATVGTQSGTLATGESALKISVHVDGHNLTYKKQNKRHAGRLIIVTALFDLQNHFLAGAETVMDMSLKDSTRAQIIHDGVDAKLTLQAPPGNYRLREVVQDVVGGKMATLTQPVQIQ